MKRYTISSGLRKWSTASKVLVSIALLGLVIGTYMLRHTYDINLRPVSASQRSVLVTIPSGATVKEIALLLQQKNLIRSSWAFEWYVRNHDIRDRLQAGTYYLRPNQGVIEIINSLTHGKVATDLVTILPGQRLDQISEALVNNARFKPDAVTAALKPELYKDSPALSDKPATSNLEGYLFPESFQKTADTKPETIIRASLAEMQKRLTPEIREAITKQGLTVHEGVILASIIEQEVGDPKKPGDTNYKPTVAQVFLSRLKNGMALGSDVTAFYGAIKAGQNLTEGQALLFDSPYNTRLHAGMPPGPISNVSATSLYAVAHPSNTDYLFFVAGDDGVTYFSKTIAEHEALTAQHCKKLCQN